MLFFLIVIGIPLISQYVSSQMRKRFVQFSNQPVPWSGREIAEMMLADHGITNVRVISTAGQLTDHYDPLKDTVNLSQPVYEQRNVAAAAVAAHECGHAVQDATQYSLLMARTKMVPVLKLSNIAMPVLFFGGATVTELLGMHGTAVLCAVGFGLPALFSLMTLPVEFPICKCQKVAFLGSHDLRCGRTRIDCTSVLFCKDLPAAWPVPIAFSTR